MSPGALDLLEKMLVFDPNKRITGTRKELIFSCGITLTTGCCFVFFFFFGSLFPQIQLLYFWICLQLKRHFVTHTCHLFMISTMSLSALVRSVLILSNHRVLKNTSKSSSGGNQWSSIQTQPIRRNALHMQWRCNGKNFVPLKMVYNSSHSLE